MYNTLKRITWVSRFRSYGISRCLQKENSSTAVSSPPNLSQSINQSTKQTKTHHTPSQRLPNPLTPPPLIITPMIIIAIMPLHRCITPRHTKPLLLLVRRIWRQRHIRHIRHLLTGLQILKPQASRLAIDARGRGPTRAAAVHALAGGVAVAALLVDVFGVGPGDRWGGDGSGCWGG